MACKSVNEVGFLQYVEITDHEKNKFDETFPKNMINLKWGIESDKLIKRLSIVTGKNGLGKSRLLEIIRWIFNTGNGAKGGEATKRFKWNSDATIDTHLTFIRFDARIVDLKGDPYNRKGEAYPEYNFYQDNNADLSPDGVNITNTKSDFSFAILKNLIIECNENLNDLNEYLKNRKVDGESFPYEIKWSYKNNNQQLEFQRTTGETIRIFELSPGEQLILILLLWEYVSKREQLKEKIFKENQRYILLLDEPDVFLHPSAVIEVVKIIKEVLVENLGIQVIMTTHNPTTIALFVKEKVPKECFFRLYLDEHNNILIGNPSRDDCSDVFNELHSGLLCIDLPFRVVFVEGNDAMFYENIKATLIKMKLLNQNVNLIFKAAGGSKDKNTIINIVRSSTASQNGDENKLKEYIGGIVDRDNDSVIEETNLFSLKRYAIENYIFDPLNVFLISKECLDLYPNDSLKNAITYIDDRIKAEFETDIDKIKIIELEREKCKAILQLIIDCFSDIFKKYLSEDTKKQKENNKKLFKYQNDIFKLSTDWIQASSFDINKLNKLVEEHYKNKHNNDQSECLKDAYDYVAEELINEIFSKNRSNIIRIRSYEVDDIELEYPKLFLDLRGHTLEEMYNELFLSQPKFTQKIKKNFLNNSRNNQNLISKDIIECMRKLSACTNVA